MTDRDKAGPPFATLALCLLLVGVWIGMQWAGGSTSPEVLHRFGMRRALWGFSESPWRLLSSLFLHYGWLHLTCNLLSLLVLGGGVEKVAGRASIPFLFFFSGLAGALASLQYSPQAGSLGASGAIFGLAGALLVLIWRFPSDHRGYQTVILLLMVALGLRPEVAGLSVDRYAHLGGFLAGLVAAVALRPRLDWRLAAPLALALAGLVYAMTRGPRLPF